MAAMDDSPSPITVDTIKSLAETHDYDIVHESERYNHVLYLFKELDNRTCKVQVYPVTRVASVCLATTPPQPEEEEEHHFAPYTAQHYLKTDLTTADLEHILEHPQHPPRGVEVFRRESAMTGWTNTSNLQSQEMRDVACRWRHVATATGLCTDPEEVVQIMKFCHDFDHCMFEEGVHACLHHSRLGCGSLCSLSNILLDVGREYHDVVGFCLIEQAMLRHRGEIEEAEYESYFPQCQNHDDYMDEFGDEVLQLRDLLVSLRPELRCELTAWFFERIRCPWQQITMLDSNEMPLFGEKTFPIHFACMDYSKLVYSDQELNLMCGMHGVFEVVMHRAEGDSDNETEQTEPESGSDADED